MAIYFMSSACISQAVGKSDRVQYYTIRAIHI